MRVDARRAAAVMAVTFLVYAAWGLPLRQSQQQKPAPKGQPAQPADQPQQQPAGQQQGPPPGGQLVQKPGKITSSRQGKETASAGFNGVDDKGQVDPAKLKEPPTADDTAKAMQLSIYAVKDADVVAFAQTGNLNLTPPPPPAQDQKKKKGK
jgi:hypothetical protein